MRPEIEKWLSERKKEEMLIRNGLYYKKEITKDEYEENNLFFQAEKKNGRVKYYKLIPYSMSDEEYNEVSQCFKTDAYSKEDDMEEEEEADDTRIGVIIKNVAIILLVLNIVIAVVGTTVFGILTQEAFSAIMIFIVAGFCGVFSFCLLSGFGHIVSDVKEIKNDLKNSNLKDK